ncbi:MAG: (5-formylfuran-3-yl)methyl phosphate synthase [Bradymonadaceae bacterium]
MPAGHWGRPGRRRRRPRRFRRDDPRGGCRTSDHRLYGSEWSLVRTVRKWHSHTWVLPAGFVDKDMQRFFKPFEQGAELAADIDPDGLMIDTLNKAVDKGLLDYCSLADIADLADQLHAQQRQLWVAGGITAEELPALWDTGADVVCVRVAACAKTDKYGRFGEVDAGIVRRLTRTLPD